MPQPAFRATETTVAQTAEAMRWLDWRFLLPDPSLGRVGYSGAIDDGLLSALEATADSVRRAHAGDRARFDVVVVNLPAALTLREIHQALRTGGSVYIQHSQFNAPSSAYFFRWILGTWGWRKALSAAGFVGVAVHWHSPDFANCRRILPLEPNVVAHAARKYGSLVAFVASVATRLGITGRLAPHISIVARKP